MLTARKIIFPLMIWLVSGITISSAPADAGRWEVELSGDGWRLWRDFYAEWKNDILYLPPVNIDDLPINPPTCGWENLDIVYDKKVSMRSIRTAGNWLCITGKAMCSGMQTLAERRKL